MYFYFYFTTGSFKRNPLFFHHFFLDSLKVSLDDQNVPSKPLIMKYSDKPHEGLYERAFQTIFKAAAKDCDVGIDRYSYPAGYTLYVVDLEPEFKKVRGQLWPTCKDGNLKIELHFAKKLDQPVSLICYGTFPSKIKIDKARRIMLKRKE